LTAALAVMGEGRYGRAEVSLRVDLALALKARGDAKEARVQARRAAELAGRTGSQRQRRRIGELLLTA
jgi:Flp pilus assembly protein TadD